MSPLPITYWSDILCIWAYIGQARMDEVQAGHGDSVAITPRFVSVFGDTHGKIAASWKDRDGFAGYARHVQSVAARFPHVSLSPAAWTEVQPASSMGPHLFAKAVSLWEAAQHDTPQRHQPLTESMIWTLRRGFFADALDISRLDVQLDLAHPFGIPMLEIERLLESGAPQAALAADYQDAEKSRIEGSPTLVLNEGRQKLYGNVGYRIIDANIRELLREPATGQASWC